MLNQPSRPTELNPKIIRKVSVVESFYNPLENDLKKAFKELWKIHFDVTNEKTFYNRLAKPNLEDYGLILYFLEVKETDSHVKDFFTPLFVADGVSYPTYKNSLKPLI